MSSTTFLFLSKQLLKFSASGTARLHHWRYEGERRGSRLLVSVTFLFMLFYFSLSTIRRAMPAHVPAYVQERLFWKGVFSIGFFIRNESPSGHDLCAVFCASMCV
jgi:hypothetical protein